MKVRGLLYLEIASETTFYWILSTDKILKIIMMRVRGSLKRVIIESNPSK
jgi:hypothetical protein